ncbi:hypothetical protein OROMI_030964 [Orobanche minor]
MKIIEMPAEYVLATFKEILEFVEATLLQFRNHSLGCYRRTMNRVLSTIRGIRTGRRGVESDFSAFKEYVYNKKLLRCSGDPAIGFRPGHVGRFKLSICWPLSIVGADRRDLYEEEGLLHGLWPLIRLLTPDEMRRHHVRLLLKTHKEFFLRHWPSIHDPKSIGAANRFIRREWTKHGKPAGIPLIDYTYHALCLKCSLPNNFGICVGVEMSLSHAGECVRSILRDLNLFGVHIGADVLPEISAVQNPKRGGPFLIDEVRPHFETSRVDRNRVMLPSRAID